MDPVVSFPTARTLHRPARHVTAAKLNVFLKFSLDAMTGFMKLDTVMDRDDWCDDWRFANDRSPGPSHSAVELVPEPGHDSPVQNERPPGRCFARRADRRKPT